MVDLTLATTKETVLRHLIGEMRSVLVSFSGGVDSSYLLKVAHDTLGPAAVAATGLSQTYATEEMEEARMIAEEIGAEHIMVETAELTDPRYADNTHQRCFFCKTELYSQLSETARKRGLDVVIDGSNADDLDDFRPGMRAARDLGVRSPLQEVDLTKAEIRVLSAQHGLRTWDKPAMACLSSRVPYGTPVTIEVLDGVGAAEAFLRTLGLRELRVRHHGDVARIETDAAGMVRLLEDGTRERVVERLRTLGYLHVALDLAGFVLIVAVVSSISWIL